MDRNKRFETKNEYRCVDACGLLLSTKSATRSFLDTINVIIDVQLVQATGGTALVQAFSGCCSTQAKHLQASSAPLKYLQDSCNELGNPRLERSLSTTTTQPGLTQCSLPVLIGSVFTPFVQFYTVLNYTRGSSVLLFCLCFPTERAVLRLPADYPRLFWGHKKSSPLPKGRQGIGQESPFYENITTRGWLKPHHASGIRTRDRQNS